MGHCKRGGRGAKPSFQNRFFCTPKAKKHLPKIERFSSVTSFANSGDLLSKLLSAAVPFAMALGFSMIKGATGATELCFQFSDQYARIVPDGDTVAQAFSYAAGIGGVNSWSCGDLKNITLAKLQPAILEECYSRLAEIFGMHHDLYGATRLNTTGGVNVPPDFDAAACRNLRSGENLLFVLLAISFMAVGFGFVCCRKDHNHTPPHGNANTDHQPLLAAQQHGADYGAMPHIEREIDTLDKISLV